MTTKTAPSAAEREHAALLRVERAARRVIRYPGDRAPMQSLRSAIANLNDAREKGQT